MGNNGEEWEIIRKYRNSGKGLGRMGNDWNSEEWRGSVRNGGNDWEKWAIGGLVGIGRE